jgi:CO/xanthine dehydrogenase Mo-binding subunit
VWTALAQIAAEELDVGLDQVRVAGVSTTGSPDEGVTSGSRSIQDCGGALRQVCAQVRAAFLAEAAEKLGADAAGLTIRRGLASTGPASTGPASTGPASTGPASAGPASAGPASTGPASAGPASAGPTSAGPASTADIPSWTPASKNLSRELRLRGFSFTGPVTAYATMQACGIVDDHLLSCFRRGAYSGSA